MLMGAVLTTAVVLVVGAVVDISTRNNNASELAETQLYDIREALSEALQNCDLTHIACNSDI
jgi:hypothetical protein